jgi:hypothetical protein
MRSTPELIAELEEEARDHWVVVMAIGFETSTVFLRPTDENRLAMLNSAIQAGGIPIGLIAADKTESGLAMCVRPYPEHEDEDFDAEGYLHTLTVNAKEVLESRGQGKQ